MKPEQAILNSIMEYLAVKRVWCRRMNTGAAMVSNATGKARFLRFGTPGMADILATPITWNKLGGALHILWIEVKAPGGKQSQAQENFQEEVISEAHSYIVARSIDDVEMWLNKNGVS